MERIKAEEYDEAHQKPEHKREDAELQRILHSEVPHGSALVDLGCGTGLGYELIGNRLRRYTGVDVSSAMIQCCLEKHAASMNGHVDFFCQPAEDFVVSAKQLETVVSLASIDFMAAGIVDRVIERLVPGGVFVVFYCYQPYHPDSTSEWYRGLEEFFKWAVGDNIAAVTEKLRGHGAEISSFLGQPFYNIAVVRKR